MSAKGASQWAGKRIVDQRTYTWWARVCGVGEQGTHRCWGRGGAGGCEAGVGGWHMNKMVLTVHESAPACTAGGR
eukprot:366258-Chlamydomonas_euryale.AAC.13